MKIIKDTTTKEYTCEHCNSVLEVNAKDIWHGTNEYDGHIYTRHYFICPCCGMYNYVNAEE